MAQIAERPEDSTLEIEIDASSIDTKDETRDAHMRSNDFLGVEDHPTISFRSTGVRPGAGESEWQVDGDLTIRGVTRPVTVDVEFLGGAIDPWGNRRIGFSGAVPEVDRREWDLVWNPPLERLEVGPGGGLQAGAAFAQEGVGLPDHDEAGSDGPG